MRRLIGIASLLFAAPAAAATASDWAACRTSGPQTIDACSRIIDEPGIADKARAMAYGLRAIAWGDANVDRAIADYSEAIRLDPKDAQNYSSRALAYRDEGDNDRAIADFNEEIRLRPSGAAYSARGDAWLDKGDVDRAVADQTAAIAIDAKSYGAYFYFISRASAWRLKGDFKRALADATEAIRLRTESNTASAGYHNRAETYFLTGNFRAAAEDAQRANAIFANAHSAALLFLALGRASRDGTAELTVLTDKFKYKDWPYPAVEFFLGRRSLADMRAAARKLYEKCEAEFYAGEWHLLRHNAAEARAALQTAAGTCAKGAGEYAMANAELKRLKP